MEYRLLLLLLCVSLVVYGLSLYAFLRSIVALNNMNLLHWWWRVTVVPLGKVAIVAYLLFVHDSIYAPVIVFSTIVVTLLAQIRLDPYRRQFDNYAEIGTLAVFLIIYEVAILPRTTDTFNDSSIWIVIQTVDLSIKLFFAVSIVESACGDHVRKRLGIATGK